MNSTSLNNKDTFSLLLSAIYAAETDPCYKFVSDMIYMLNDEDFKNFMALYEGQTIKIPSTNQLTKMLQALMMYAYHDIDGLSAREAADKSGYGETFVETRRLSPEYYSLKENIQNKRITIGGILSDIPTAESLDIK